jgi:hypothetical protein
VSDVEASVYARLSALQARLAQPTPPPLDGQQTIDLTPPARQYEQPALDEDDQP